MKVDTELVALAPYWELRQTALRLCSTWQSNRFRARDACCVSHHQRRGSGAGTFAGSFVLQSGYCNVNNFGLALCGSLVQKMVGNEVQYEPWIMTAGGTGIILDTTPNGITAIFSAVLN